jgi:hypothetical protein
MRHYASDLFDDLAQLEAELDLTPGTLVREVQSRIPPPLEACDCDEEGHPDLRRHASDCLALTAAAPAPPRRTAPE